MKLIIEIDELNLDGINYHNKFYDISIDYALNALVCFSENKEVILFNFDKYLKMNNKKSRYDLIKEKNYILINFY